MRALLALFLTACPSPGMVQGTIARVQEGQTCNTSQRCVQGSASVAIADRTIVVALEELQRAGFLRDYSATMAKVRGRLQSCLVPLPEACTFAGWTAGPFLPGPDGKPVLAARKRGCASNWHAWASLCWPPVCKPEWPAEPHCVPPGQSHVAGWQGALMHETFNMVVQRFLNVTSPDYSAKVYRSGVEAIVAARVDANGLGPGVTDAVCAER